MNLHDHLQIRFQAGGIAALIGRAGEVNQVTDVRLCRNMTSPSDKPMANLKVFQMDLLCLVLKCDSHQTAKVGLT